MAFSKTLVGRILPISSPIADALDRRRARRDPTSQRPGRAGSPPDRRPFVDSRPGRRVDRRLVRGRAPTCPPRGRTSSISPTTPAGARIKSSASPGTRATRPGASSGSRPGARRRWWGGFFRSRRPLPRPWRDGGHDVTLPAHSASTVTASPSAAGVRPGGPTCGSRSHATARSIK